MPQVACHIVLEEDEVETKLPQKEVEKPERNDNQQEKHVEHQQVQQSQVQQSKQSDQTK